jgi:hypothetical protein
VFKIGTEVVGKQRICGRIFNVLSDDDLGKSVCSKLRLTSKKFKVRYENLHSHKYNMEISAKLFLPRKLNFFRKSHFMKLERVTTVLTY